MLRPMGQGPSTLTGNTAWGSPLSGLRAVSLGRISLQQMTGCRGEVQWNITFPLLAELTSCSILSAQIQPWSRRWHFTIACCRYALAIVPEFLTLTALCKSPRPLVQARVAGRPISCGEHARQFESHECTPTIIAPTYHCATTISFQDGAPPLVPRLFYKGATKEPAVLGYDIPDDGPGLAPSRHYFQGESPCFLGLYA